MIATDWLEALQSCRDSNTPCVLVTVIARRGSLPRKPGAKMLVSGASQHPIGSVGGGEIEFQAVRLARDILTQQKPLTTRQLKAAEDDAAAGLTLLFEPFYGSDFTIMLFGAGHVGKALVHVLAPLPCQIIWVDSRKEVFPTAEQLPSNVQARVTDTPESEVASAPADSFFLLMSHTHEQDYRIGEAVFARDDVAYLGMIGSDRKRERLEQRLHALGYSAEALAQRLVCPIGIAGIDGRQPAEIAIAVAAQLLARRQLLKNHQ